MAPWVKRLASTVIFDHDLSPKQIAKIEEVVGKKVIDRSELILDIFASRATSHEAKLQVELAQMEYTYPRLRAMWDHLERITGGGIAGIGTRGPGEQQLEIDRRLVQAKKLDLKRELDAIYRRRNVSAADVAAAPARSARHADRGAALRAAKAVTKRSIMPPAVPRQPQWAMPTASGAASTTPVPYVPSARSACSRVLG